jgi:hypothetical protein
VDVAVDQPGHDNFSRAIDGSSRRVRFRNDVRRSNSHYTIPLDRDGSIGNDAIGFIRRDDPAALKKQVDGQITQVKYPLVL